MYSEHVEKKKVHFQKITRKIFGIVLGVLTIGFFVYQFWNNPTDIEVLFSESNEYFLVLLIILQLVSFLVNAVLSNTLISLTGSTTHFIQNLKISIMNEFGNRIIPIAGGSITSYIGYRRIGLNTSSIIFLETSFTGLCLLQYTLFFMGSIIFIPQGFLTLVPRIGMLGTLICIGLILTLVFTILHKQTRTLIIRILAKSLLLLAYIFPISFDEKDIHTQIRRSGEDFHNNLRLLFLSKQKFGIVFFLSSLYLFIDVLLLLFSFKAFSYTVPLSTVIFGMTISLLLSLATLFPAQPGVTEASFVFIFSALGVPLHTAILGTIVFRLASYWIWMPLSTFYMFKKGKESV